MFIVKFNLQFIRFHATTEGNACYHTHIPTQTQPYTLFSWPQGPYRYAINCARHWANGSCAHSIWVQRTMRRIIPYKPSLEWNEDWFSWQALFIEFESYTLLVVVAWSDANVMSTKGKRRLNTQIQLTKNPKSKM